MLLSHISIADRERPRTRPPLIFQRNQQIITAVKILDRRGAFDVARRRIGLGRDMRMIHGQMFQFFLADLLAQIMPSDFYSLQYEFSNGERVDAVIRLGGKLVPVDAKFPLEQFRRMGQAVTDEERSQWRRDLVGDVKRHIDAISQKYIRPGEGTFDFALMYIPAENVYYEAVIREDGVGSERGIFQHAVRRQVIPVSPNSFYAYLQVILQGLRGFVIEERAKEILTSLMRLHKELAAMREDFDTAGKQLGHAVDNFRKAENHLSRFEHTLSSVEPPAEAALGLPVSAKELGAEESKINEASIG